MIIVDLNISIIQKLFKIIYFDDKNGFEKKDDVRSEGEGQGWPVVEDWEKINGRHSGV